MKLYIEPTCESFICPKCGHVQLREHVVGPTITREVEGVSAKHLTTLYDHYKVSVDAAKWWTCGECGYKLPATNVKELVAYLNAGCPCLEEKTELLPPKKKLRICLVGGTIGLAVAGLSVWQPIFSPLAMLAVLASLVIYLGYRK